ncbi:hypothetical protein HZ326_16412 [Fusarium oxysporum f. sp. albedinis]|nr:hypothetical protein HZ326_16412 [Fusarium oxysporum f. sp. albedinis]
MSNEERAAPGRYAQPKTPPSFECGGRIEETHHLERSDTGTPIKEKEDRTADDSTLYKCERIRAATCQNLTSIAMACWAKVKDLPRYDIAQHTTALRLCPLSIWRRRTMVLYVKSLWHRLSMLLLVCWSRIIVPQTACGRMTSLRFLINS